jgi:hypothetical protein
MLLRVAPTRLFLLLFHCTTNHANQSKGECNFSLGLKVYANGALFPPDTHGKGGTENFEHWIDEM